MKNNNADKPDPVNNVLADMDFTWIYGTYFPDLCRYAEKIVKHQEEAEDIVSDFFFILWENRENINIIKDLRPFLYQGVLNNSLKFLQHEKVLRKYCENVRYIRANGDWSHIQDNNDPLSMIILQELACKIDHAINALPAQCRKIFYLIRIEELKYQEVADRLGISIGTVRKQVNLAMTKLGNHLKIRDK